MRAKTLKSYAVDLIHSTQRTAGVHMEFSQGSVEYAFILAFAKALYDQQLGFLALLGYVLDPADVDADGLTQGVVRGL